MSKFETNRSCKQGEYIENDNADYLINECEFFSLNNKVFNNSDEEYEQSDTDKLDKRNNLIVNDINNSNNDSTNNNLGLDARTKNSLASNLTELDIQANEQQLIIEEKLKTQKNNFKAALLMITYCLLRATTSLLTKLLSINKAQNHSIVQAFEKYFVMAVLGKLYLVLICSRKVSQDSLNFIIENKLIFCLRTFFGFIGGLIFIISLNYVTISSFTAVYMISPITTSIVYSVFILKRLPKLIDLILCLSSCGFSVLVMNPFKHNNNKDTEGSLIIEISILSMIVIASSARSITQKMINKVNVMYIMFSTSIISSGVFLIIALLFRLKFSSDYKEHIIMSSLGAIEFIALYVNSYAINIGEVEFTQQFLYSLLPFSCLLSYFFADEKIGYVKIIGIVGIFTINLSNSIYSYLKFKREKEKILKQRLYSNCSSREIKKEKLSVDNKNAL